MTVDPRVKKLVRDNRGLRLHVFVVLLFSPAPLMAKEIASDIGCSADRVEDLLRPMAEDGYTSAVGAGRHPRWTLTDRARQLPLPQLLALDNGVATAIDAGPAATAIGPALAATAIGEQRAVGEGEFLPLADSEGENLPLTSHSLFVVVDLDQDRIAREDQQQQTAALRGKNCPSDSGVPPVNGDYLVFQACAEAGIFGEKRAALLADGWITADRVQRAARQAQAENRWDNPAGMAITRLLAHIEPMTDDEIKRLEAPDDVGREWQEYIDHNREKRGLDDGEAG